jgi:hypothetical protein
MATEVEQRPAPPPARLRSPGRRLNPWAIVVQLAPFILALGIYLVAFQQMNPELTGDEPHYLLVAQSIAFDRDFALDNDYASRDRTLRIADVFPLDPEPHAARYAPSAHLRPVHGIGLSALLAPAVALGGLTGAQLAMIFIAALLAYQLFRLLRQLGFRPLVRIAAWLAVVACSPVIAFTSQIYPELPGALILVVALRIMVSRAQPVALAAGSAAAATLIWLHVRYFPLAFGVLLGLALSACSARRGGLGTSVGDGALARIRAAGATLVSCAARDWRTVTLPIVAPFALGLAFFAVAFEHWYGSPNPATPYRAFSTTQAGDAGWSFLYDYALQDIFDPVHGWIPYVPVHLLGLAALGCLIVRFGWPAVGCLVFAVGYELILASAAPNIGWGLPARYLMILVPLIAVPIAVALQYVRAARLVFVPLLAVSFVFAYGAVRDLRGLYPIDDEPRILGVNRIAAAFPNTGVVRLPTGFVLEPGEYKPRTGRLITQRVIEAKAGRDGSGFLLWGPYSQLADGTYRARFPLAASGVGGNQQVADLQVVGTPPETIFGGRLVYASELEPRKLTDISVEFEMPGGFLIETRLLYKGLGTLRAGPVLVEAVDVEPLRPPPAWALSLLWVAGTVLAGWLLVYAMLRSRRVRHGRDDELVGEQ